MSILAVVGYYEEWWIQVLKAIVIFAVGLQLVPVVLLAAAAAEVLARCRVPPSQAAIPLPLAGMLDPFSFPPTLPLS